MGKIKHKQKWEQMKQWAKHRWRQLAEHEKSKRWGQMKWEFMDYLFAPTVFLQNFWNREFCPEQASLIAPRNPQGGFPQVHIPKGSSCPSCNNRLSDSLCILSTLLGSWNQETPRACPRKGQWFFLASYVRYLLYCHRLIAAVPILIIALCCGCSVVPV